MTERSSVSIVICTRNRSALLAETCEALTRLPVSDPPWELIVVDNGSTDDTGEVARSFSSRLGRPLRLLFEPEPGLSAARNRGVRESAAEVIAFLDDDAFPANGWLARLTRTLARENVYAAGGAVIPQFRSPLPSWFTDRYLPYLTVWDLGAEEQRLAYNEYPRGANMAFRRAAFERFGLFSTHLGRKKNLLLSCEEIEFCLRIERGGGRVVYVPDAAVDHVVEGERVTPDWLVARFRWQGISEAIVEWQHAGIKGLAIGIRRTVRRALETHRTSEAGDLIRQCETAGARGYLWGSLRAPLTVPRYVAPPEAGPARAWLPFR